GFSFVFDENALHHFPQIGRIVIGNHVWIGSNVCIERAALDETRIDDHCKIDDLVQIGHNANIHEACQITAGVIICGRVVLEPGCWVAPNAVIDNGVRVGHDALIGTGSVIRKDVEPNTVVAGVPGRVLRKR
ncbi:MAG TPA: UDP-3-O-(3-hydroxymyristoyl)glucosamine N-acyltransferase, partial [Candidatus Hydrogenedentes bacterium]|nr:UDP-3-O-(3-hydroxymyristoyl)glucosamine N-acyltransferase [Candidatus Hydrogenedentota bacterium]